MHASLRPSFQRAGLSLLAVLVSVSLFSGPVLGQSEDSSSNSTRTPGEVSNIVHELSQEILSPYCPGKTIEMCPSGGAAEVRREIQKLARQGKSKAAIKEAILDTYGEKYRIQEPPREDHYPLVAAIVGGLVLCMLAVFLLSRGRDDSDDSSPDDPSMDDLDDDDEVYLEAIRREYTD